MGTKSSTLNYSLKPPHSSIPPSVNMGAAKSWEPNSEKAENQTDTSRSYHSVVGSPYALPKDLKEQDRLNLQHLLYRHSFGRF
ncbi:hypothetical protein HK096_008351 [Nowakowskiella sp. JEL0078]|nr:hypothetical protein HK096_008351 [Nowakowskiella sp. JEL0078]